MLAYFSSHFMDLLRALVEHAELSATALFLASLLALPLGHLLAARAGKLSDTVLAALGLLYSIPSMALLVFLVPVFGLGNVSAVIALVLYAQFVLVRSVVLGFRGVDPNVREAAKGMGLNPAQLLLRVELPLALPTLIGGLRIAASSVIGIATIAAWINAGGLGSLLFEGIYQNHIPKILWGVVLISGFALLIELALLDIEKHALLESRGQGVFAS